MDFEYFRHSIFVTCSFDNGQPFFTHVMLPPFTLECADDNSLWFLGALRNI